ncbi:MAG: amidase, partial [Comamonadaceae bacterium]
VGLFTRSVADMARWSGAIAGHAWQPAQRQPVFGIAWDWPWEPLSPSARLALETARRTLEAAGATVREVGLPAWLGTVFKAHDAVQGWEAARALADEFDFHREQLSPILRDYLVQARTVGDAAYEQGQAEAALGRSRLHELFDGIDVLLCPSAPDEAPQGFGSTGASTWNRAWTLLHVPCLNVPGAVGVTGLPMGVQVIAPLRGEAACLQAGALLEAALAKALPPG